MASTRAPSILVGAKEPLVARLEGMLVLAAPSGFDEGLKLLSVMDPLS